MGRKVEETMVHMAVAAASARASKLVAKYLPTAKNKPCHTFWKGSGFVESADGSFSWDASLPYALPEPIHLAWER
jgi:predicted enzyme involved in methoxymalonyl-ACP biosynthesis